MALNEALLKRLIETPSVSGREEQQREIAREELGDLTDEVRTDVMGSVIGTKRGNSDVRVMTPSPSGKPSSWISTTRSHRTSHVRMQSKKYFYLLSTSDAADDLTRGKADHGPN